MSLYIYAKDIHSELDYAKDISSIPLKLIIYIFPDF